MPEILMNSFHSGAEITRFRWVDDSAEDGDFVSFAVGNIGVPNGVLTFANFTVDRTGTPELRWDVVIAGDPTVVDTGSIALVPNTYWSGSYYKPSAPPSPVDMTGYWECDQYGRPFDLDDLVAPPAP